jgi:hypothetical protein
LQHQFGVEEFEHGLFLHDRLSAGDHVATTISQRLPKASESTDFADGAPTS